jgi:hypothetical protein
MAHGLWPRTSAVSACGRPSRRIMRFAAMAQCRIALGGRHPGRLPVQDDVRRPAQDVEVAASGSVPGIGRASAITPSTMTRSRSSSSIMRARMNRLFMSVCRRPSRVTGRVTEPASSSRDRPRCPVRPARVNKVHCLKQRAPRLLRHSKLPGGREPPGGIANGEEDPVHPMFVELFLAADEDELSSGEQQRRRGRRARRNRLVMTRAAARPGQGPPRPGGIAARAAPR